MRTTRWATTAIAIGIVAVGFAVTLILTTGASASRTPTALEKRQISRETLAYLELADPTLLLEIT